jgi:LAO/AO transport system kinase
MWQQWLDKIVQGDMKALARCISLVENEAEGYEALLRLLPSSDKPLLALQVPRARERVPLLMP